MMDPAATNMEHTDRRPAILVVTELYPNVTNSFIGTFVVGQLRQLRRHYQVVVLTTHAIPYAQRHTTHQPAFRNDDGIHVYSLPYYPRWLMALVRYRLINRQRAFAWNKRVTAIKLLRMARQLHAKYRFRFVHGHEIYVGDEAVPIARAIGRPSVFTLHGVYDYHRHIFGSSVVTSALEHIRGADWLIAVSRVAANSYRAHGLDRDDFAIIPNGVAAVGRPNPDPDIRSFAAGRTVLLSVGFFAPEKRLERSIKTLGAVRRAGSEAVLVLVGKGEQGGELRRLTAAEGLSDFVKFTGEIKPTDMPAVYAAADILLHPSVIESFSMVCAEAMSMGLPVICTEGIGIVEYLRPGTDAIVVPADAQLELDATTIHLVRDRGRRQRLGQAAQSAAAAFAWPAIIPKILDLYASIHG